MTVCGNPPEYILLFGGISEEILTDSVSTVSKIRKPMNDIWVYFTGTRLWQRLYVNSPTRPELREMSVLATIKTDRLLLMYGGLSG